MGLYCHLCTALTAACTRIRDPIHHSYILNLSARIDVGRQFNGPHPAGHFCKLQVNRSLRAINFAGLTLSPRSASALCDTGLAEDGKFKFDPFAFGSNSGGAGGNDGGAKVSVPRNVTAGLGGVTGASRLTISCPIAVADGLMVKGIVAFAGSELTIDDPTEVTSLPESPMPGVGAEAKEITFSGWTRASGEPPMVCTR